jgi:Fe-S oxidoreductase
MAKNANLEKMRYQVFSCARCGVCTSKYNWWSTHRVCPVAEHSVGLEVYYPRGKVGIARGILEGEFDYSEGIADLLTHCTSCMNCVKQCGAVNNSDGEPRIPTPEIIEAMRADIWELGMCNPYYKAVGERIQKERNPYGEPKDKRKKWAEKLNVSFVGAKKQ